MHKKLEQSKFLLVLTALLLVFNSLTPAVQVIAAESTKVNKWINSVSLIKIDGSEEAVHGKTSLIDQGDNENSIVFDLSDRYAKESDFIGIHYGVDLKLDEDVKAYNESGKEIGGTAGLQGFFEEANKTYTITLRNKDEEEIDLTILIKTKDYDPQVKVTGFTSLKPLSIEASDNLTELEASLPKEVELLLSNKTKRSVKVAWQLDRLDLSKPGSQKLMGEYQLPEGVIGEKIDVYLMIEVTKAKTLKEELQNLIETADHLKASDYTEASYAELTQAVARAKDALESDEKAIEEAIDVLNRALKSLVYKENKDFEFDKETKTILKYIGKDSVVEIPEEIEGVAVEHLGEKAFSESVVSGQKITKVTLPRSLKTIGEKAFFRIGLKEVQFNNNLTDIGLEAFRHNELSKVSLPKTVVKLEEAAFANNKLTEVSLGQIKQIDKQAFMNNKIKTIELPESLEEIGVHAFANNELSSLNIPSKLKDLKGFGNNKLTEITIPETVEVIGKSAFASNELTQLDLPDSVTQIHSDAFANNDLKQIKFGKAIEKIGQKAFEKNKLVDIYLPESIKEIESEAFNDNRITNQTAKINSKKTAVRLGNKAFENASPIFLKDIEASLKFDYFELFSTKYKERLILSKTHENRIEFLVDDKIREIIQEELKENRVIYRFKVAEGIDVYSKGEKVTNNQIEIDQTEDQTVTLKAHGVEKTYFIDLNTVNLDLLDLNKALTQAEEKLATGFLTSDSKVALEEAYDQAIEILKQTDKTNNQVIQAKEALQAANEAAKVTLIINDSGQVISYNGIDETVEIPAYWKGVPVKEINKNVFKNKQIKKLILPETLEKIGQSAFEGNELTELEFVESQLTQALNKYGVSSQQRLVIEAAAFKNNQLTHLYLPYGVKVIQNDAFSENDLSKFSVQIDNYEKNLVLGENVFGGVAPTFLRTDYRSVDKTYLSELLSRDYINAKDFTADSFANYQSAYEEAKEVSERKASQEEVNQVTRDLDEAFNQLIPVADVDEARLKDLMEQIKALDPAEISSDAYRDVMFEINFLESKDNLSKEVINEAYQNLTKLLGEIETNPKLFGYEIINQHEVALTDYRGMSTTLVIPSTLDGKKVTTISSAAFKNKGLENLIIPASVHTIGDHAFSDNALTSLTLPPYLKKLGQAAFKSNHLTKLDLSSARLKEIEEESFYRNSQLKEVVLTEGLEKIGRQAFAKAEIESIELPKSLVEIEALALASNKLTELSLHENVATIGDFAFHNNQIEQGKATINNIEKNVEVGQGILDNNPSEDLSISLVYLGEEIVSLIAPEFDVLEVEAGRSEKDVLKQLPKEVSFKIDRQIKMRTSNELTLDVTWSSSNYQAVEGLYTFEASYELPEGFANKPELQIQVKVLAEASENQALKDALAHAKAVNENKDATVEEVKEAKERLEALLNPIQLEEAKDKLQALIEKAKQADLTNKTPASIDRLEARIDQAEALLTQSDLSKEQVNQMINDLNAALNQLVDQANKDLLVEKIKEAKVLDTSDKTLETIDKLEASIEKAEEINENKNATQAEVDQAIKTLEEAIEGLTDRVYVDSVQTFETIEVAYGTAEENLPLPKELKVNLTNKETLSLPVKWVAKVRTAYDGTKPGEYKFIGSYDLPAFIEGEKPVVELLVRVLEADLVEEKVDKSALKDLVKEAKVTDLTAKTKETVEKLEQAIKEAEAVLADKNATQAEVDQAIKVLEKAIKGLTDRVYVDSVQTFETIEVAYGTAEEDLPLPKQLKVNLTNKETLSLPVKWKIKSHTAYDGTKPGKYEFAGSYDLPASVEGKKPLVSLTVKVLEEVVDKSSLEKLVKEARAKDVTAKTKETVEKLEQAIKEAEAVLADKNATQAEVDAAIKALEKAIEGLEDRVFVDSVQSFDLIEVAYGTAEQDLLLPKELKVTLTNKKTLSVPVEWKIKSHTAYDGTKPGEYEFEGSYDLPASVEGEKPFVTLKVKVLEDKTSEEAVDKSVLVQLVKEARAKDVTAKTKETVEKLEQAIKEAETILADKNATQAEVDAVIKGLNKALAQLKDKENQPGSGGSTPPGGSVGSGEVSTPPGGSAGSGNGSTLPGSGDESGDAPSDEKTKDKAGKEDKKEKLPKTATTIFNTVAVGLFLIMFGLFFIRQRKMI